MKIEIFYYNHLNDTEKEMFINDLEKLLRKYKLYGDIKND